MSIRRQGACQMPGPRDAHCTDHPMHQWSCYDAGEDVSWNEGQWYDFDLAPHACDDPGCRDQDYRGPAGRESEYGAEPTSEAPAVKLIPAPDHRSPEQRESDETAAPLMATAMERMAALADGRLGRLVADAVREGSAAGSRLTLPLLWDGDQA